jgi:uncharacterized protein YndB with AHSA1/START domain
VTKKTETGASPAARRRITIERTYQAPIEDLWDLWTTKEGIESWWGPDGFVVKVRKLDLRPGGELHYAMIATAPEQIEFMKRAVMPLTTECRVTYTEVVPPRRLAYEHLADFIPGVQPYVVAMVVELHPSAQGVRMVLTFDAMHDEEWTQRAVMGWENELGKLAKVLAA